MFKFSDYDITEEEAILAADSQALETNIRGGGGGIP